MEIIYRVYVIYVNSCTYHDYRVISSITSWKHFSIFLRVANHPGKTEVLKGFDHQGTNRSAIAEGDGNVTDLHEYLQTCAPYIVESSRVAKPDEKSQFASKVAQNSFLPQDGSRVYDLNHVNLLK